MTFNFRKVQEFTVVCIEIDSVKIDMGWLNKDEVRSLAAELREAANEVLYVAGIEDSPMNDEAER